VRVSFRYHAVGFLQDFSLFTAWTVIPLWAEFDLHSSALALGALPIFGGVTYVATSYYAGRLSDRFSRTRLARIGLALFALFCLAAWRASSLAWVYLCAPLSGVANGLIWPGLQAKMGDESGSDNLERNVGAFSVAWCLGKAAGFFVAALAKEHLGMDALPLCGLLSLLAIPLVPARHVAHREGRAPLVAGDGPPPEVRRAYLRAAWVANFASYGFGAVFTILYPKVVRTGGGSEGAVSLVLGTLYLSQTAFFWLFGRYAGWRYRKGAFLGWQAAGAAALLAIGLGAPVAAAVPLAVLGGAGLGLSYLGSIYYSVHSDEDRGARAGLHEVFTGASNFVVPLGGGAFQEALGAAGLAWNGAAFAFGGAVVAAALVAQAALVRRAGRAPPYNGGRGKPRPY